MKKGTKIGLFSGLFLLSAVALAGCTNSFCSTEDQAHMMYAFDFGVSKFYQDDGETVIPDDAEQLVIGDYTVTGIKVSYSVSNCPALTKIYEGAAKENIPTPSLKYWVMMDNLVLEQVYAASSEYDWANMTADILKNDVLKEYGNLKFTTVTGSSTAIRWDAWDKNNEAIRTNPSIAIDELPSTDFVDYYKTQMKNFVKNYRTCLATRNGYYGYYGTGDDEYRGEIFITGKDYGYAWKRGFFEGLLVYPIGALTDVIAMGMWDAGAPKGLASVVAILVVTLIIRSFMLIFTIGTSTQTAKMNELQPEIQKIQAKYPNSNTSQTERMRLAEETQKLYKKHGIHPFRSILTIFIQFPIFICVWGALSGSAALSTGSIFGLNLSIAINQVLFNADAWKSGAGLTALILFLLMAGSQVVSMLLPQWIQKAKAKKVAKMGRNPAQKSNDNKMKIFTYVMLAMVIFMGFTLASGMGIYWFIGAIYSIIQTLITQAVTSRKKKGKK